MNWLSQHSGPAVPASHGDTAAGPEADGRTGRAAELILSDSLSPVTGSLASHWSQCTSPSHRDRRCLTGRPARRRGAVRSDQVTVPAHAGAPAPAQRGRATVTGNRHGLTRRRLPGPLPESLSGPGPGRAGTSLHNLAGDIRVCLHSADRLGRVCPSKTASSAEMALADLDSRSDLDVVRADLSIAGLMINSAFSGYAKRVISSQNFISAVASIKMRQDAVKLAQSDVFAELNALPAHEKEAYYAAFPRNPAEFSNVLAYWLSQLSEMNQATFGMENIKEPNKVYMELIQNTKLVVFSTIPCNHILVYRRNNRWNLALKDTLSGCNLVSKYHYFLTSAVKQFVRIHLLALCRTDTDQGFLDYQMHPSNFQNRMEAAREILINYLLSEDNPRLVTQLRHCHYHLQQISESAAAASSASSFTATPAHLLGSCSTPSTSALFLVLASLHSHHYSQRFLLSWAGSVAALSADKAADTSSCKDPLRCLPSSPSFPTISLLATAGLHLV